MEIFRQIEGHLQELESGQKATTRDFGLLREDVGRLEKRLDTMGKRSESMEAEMRWLRGDFASIEGLLTSQQVQLNEHLARIEALEKRAS